MSQTTPLRLAQLKNQMRMLPHREHYLRKGITPRYKFCADSTDPPVIAPLNRNEASNPDLFYGKITARLREDHKRATRQIREAGWIPSYFRGRNKLPDMMIQVPAKPFARDFENGLFSHQKLGRVKLCGPTYELRMEEGARGEDGELIDMSWIPFERVRVLLQNIMIHPMDYVPSGFQFTYVPENEPVRVRVPIVCINQEKSPALREGAWLNNLVRFVDIRVPPFVKPPIVCMMDVSGLRMKDKLCVGDLQFEGKDEGCRMVLPDDTPTTMVSKA